MCGIAGFVYTTTDHIPPENVRRDTLVTMTDAIMHRGPDGDGQIINGPAALGHRRLSIIDLAGGSQPLTDTHGRAVVTFNGEIYNFQEIRTQLLARGHTFATNSDTEVLVAAYLEYGPACLNLFEGMFAFAIWDTTKKTLFAARDRFGKKPLFYTLQHGLFAFASELTALRKHPDLRFHVTKEALARFLSYLYVPTPQSIFKDVFKLKAGHYLTLENGQINTQCYWDLPGPLDRIDASEEEICSELRRLGQQAVSRRLVSDVPLGVFLSGGVDSSTVAALMAQISDKVKTFSIGFSEKSYDESQFAQLVADKYKTDHHVKILSAADCGSLLPEIVSRFDEPMADPSIVPTYLLSKVTRERVTVALGGDGADELFAGYEHFIGFNLIGKYLALPAVLRHKFIEPLARRLPMSTGYVNPRLVAEEIMAGAAVPRWLCIQTWLSALSPDMQMQLWNSPDRTLLDPNNLFASTRALFDASPSDIPLAKAFYAYAKQYLLDYILVKVDRCSMMHSLEVRAPFLDRDFAEFVARLPLRLKLKGTKRKYIMKKAFGDLLPDGIANRQKRGFLIPSALWLKTNLRPDLERLLGKKHLNDQGLFNPAYAQTLMDEHFSDIRDHRMPLWTMLVLQLWLEANAGDIVE
ncbi:asparagine synthase (glutamine-hydrolyzing) [Desulfovibrio inopinatus]|uniref:asparagine synthase (glutamine-hydrolyzing) n=1 Tax=Desulfovibrio inopinatus TaxID=102109 RepID=UPI00040AFE4A|nr:asparagine synthase (glutamine-hydrolyzing) [Desulfovibrio inopinatus]